MEKSVSSYWLAPGKAVSPAPVKILEKEPPRENTTPEDFIAFAVQYFKLDPKAFVKTTKYNCKDFVSIKHMVRFYLLDAYQLSLNAVGRLTRNTDHTNVINSRDKHIAYMEVHPPYRRLYEPFQKEAWARGFQRREATNV